MPNLIRNAIRTPDGTVLQSRYRHDYQTYVDTNGKEYMVDGGLSYSRRSAHGDEVDMCLYDIEPHEVQRDVLEWGSTLDANGNRLPDVVYRKISELETSHLQAILALDADGQPVWNVAPTHRKCMENELKYRGINS